MKALVSFVIIFGLALTGCGGKGGAGGASGGGDGGDGGDGGLQKKAVIQNQGSDTMVNLAQAWAEAYTTVAPNVSVEVSGGGSGTGVAALINGTTDIANCSRSMKPSELEKAKAAHGIDPIEWIMGFDALAVYVHKDNPMEEITLDQLAQIYGKDGGADGKKVTKWSELGVTIPSGNDGIICISRQSNSGTYVYFRETILGKTGDFRLGSRDLHGSKDVVETVASTSSAVGYSGMGYATKGVKMLKVSKKTGEPGYGPSVENTLSKNYPIARPLFCYTLGEPKGEQKKYLDWCLGPEGQEIVEKSGYVSTRKK